MAQHGLVLNCSIRTKENTGTYSLYSDHTSVNHELTARKLFDLSNHIDTINGLALILC